MVRNFKSTIDKINLTVQILSYKLVL